MASGEADVAQELAEWFTKLKLTPYIQKAEEWRQEMGAASLEEIHDNIDDFIERLQLKPLEIRRMRKSIDEKGAAASNAPAAPASSAGYASAASASDASASLLAGSTGKFGDVAKQQKEYLLFEELGSGATATVYKCRQKLEPSQPYAVKTINLKNLQMQPQYKRMHQVLQREMQILFGLKHPRIVTLYDVIEESDKLYLVMECVADGELFDCIVKRGTLTEPGSKNVFCQIVDALKYIHSQDIVYRDLKPENILVSNKALNDDKNIQIKLSDFGHSKLINDGYSTALTRVGTPQYWAPEVSDRYSAQNGYDKKVDLWSLGVVLYVMLMGAYPFDGVSEPIERQIKDPHKWLTFRSPVTGRFASQPAQNLIQSLIVRQPERRFSLEQCLSHAWTANTNVVQSSADEVAPEYFGLQLPSQPSKEQRDVMRTDLLKFQQKFKCFAQVRHSQVVADLSGMTKERVQEAKSDLKGIIQYNLKIEPMEVEVKSLSGSGQSLDTIDEQGGTSKLITTTLRVGESGAGLDLVSQNDGMLVQKILSQPGQPGLREGDIITKINEVSLAGDPAMVEQKFGQNFVNGVQIQVKRRS
jgi:serine/threonine protein kinase